MSFDLSIERVLARRKELRAFGPALTRLPGVLEALVPATATALLDLNTREDFAFGDADLHALVLAFDGYDPDVCRDMLEQAERARGFPGWTQMLLMPEKQMQAKLGTRLGQVIAGAIADPRSQPIMHALIQMEAFPPPPGEYMPYNRVVRRSSEYTLLASLRPGELRNLLNPHRELLFTNPNWRVENRRPVEPHVARHHYQTATGMCLPDEICFQPPLYIGP